MEEYSPPGEQGLIQVVVVVRDRQADAKAGAQGMQRLDACVVEVVLLIEQRAGAEKALGTCLLHGVGTSVLVALCRADKLGLENALFPTLALPGHQPLDHLDLGGFISSGHALAAFTEGKPCRRRGGSGLRSGFKAGGQAQKRIQGREESPRRLGAGVG